MWQAVALHRIAGVVYHVRSEEWQSFNSPAVCSFFGAQRTRRTTTTTINFPLLLLPLCVKLQLKIKGKPKRESHLLKLTFCAWTLAPWGIKEAAAYLCKNQFYE
jgi:hypothetical protein